MFSIFGKCNKYRENAGSLKSHKKSILIFAMFFLLAVGMGLKGRMDAMESTGKAERAAEGGNSQNRTFVYQIDGSEKQELTLDIAPVERAQDEVLELLESAAAQWENIYLGENVSADEVRYDLNLPNSLFNGLVKISYESSNNTILQINGEIMPDVLPEEGELVELTVTFSYAEYTRIETYGLYIQMPEVESAEWFKMKLLEKVQQEEQSSRDQTSFSLPDSIAGHTVIWEQKQDFRWVFMIFLGLIAVFCLEWKEKEDAKKRKKARNSQLMFEYPQMVDQMSILLDSGMTIRKAWERMLETDRHMQQNNCQGKEIKPTCCERHFVKRNSRENQRIFVEEMWITYREIQEGRGEQDAYERFGKRIGLMPYRRFGSILSQNLSKGTRDIKLLLRKEAAEALEMRKNRARRMGEEAGTKMLFPMLVMLVLILLVLLLPAITEL